MSALRTDQYPIAHETEGFAIPGPEGVFVARSLEPYSTENVESDVSLYDPQDVKNLIGFSASVPLVVDAGDKRLLVVDVRSYPSDDKGYRQIRMRSGQVEGWYADYLLVSPQEWNASNGERGYKAARAGEPVVFGRKEEKVRQRFDGLDEVSREHFQITYTEDEGIAIKDLGSTNGTAITAAPYEVVADRSRNVDARIVADAVRYSLPDGRAPYGYFDGRPVIGRNSPRISGGVYLGGTSREAVTVEPELDPRIEDVYQKFLSQQSRRQVFSRAIRGNRLSSIQDQLEQVKDAVRGFMRYDGAAVEELSSRYAGDQLVSLGEYIQNGTGVCRHQGLLAGYFMERMLSEGRLPGIRAKVERNAIREFGGAHGWATLVAADGREYVVDPAQNFVGTKQEARQKPGTWDYYLPLQ